MRLNRIKVDGYRNISDVELVLNTFNALVALNNYGKSNVIEAINFAIDFISAPNKTKAKLMSYSSLIPINKEIAGKSFSFCIEGEIQKNDCKWIVEYSFAFDWLHTNSTEKPKITKELLRVKSDQKNARFTTYIKRDDEEKVYLSAEKGRCDKLIKADDETLILNKLANFDDLFYIDILNCLNKLKFISHDLDDVERQFSTSFIIDDNGPLEGQQVSELPSIPKFFFDLKQNNPDDYALLEGVIIDLFPEIETISPEDYDFKKNDNINPDIPFVYPEKLYDIRVKLKWNNQATSVKSLSVGTKRVFYILAMVLSAHNKNITLLCFEELENSIHPALLQRLLDIIIELTGETKVLITSHSTHLIKYLTLDDIFLGIPNHKGIASFKKIKKTKHRKMLSYAADAESNLGDFIFDMLLDEESYENEFWSELI